MYIKARLNNWQFRGLVSTDTMIDQKGRVVVLEMDAGPVGCFAESVSLRNGAPLTTINQHLVPELVKRGVAPPLFEPTNLKRVQPSRRDIKTMIDYAWAYVFEDYPSDDLFRWVESSYKTLPEGKIGLAPYMIYGHLFEGLELPDLAVEAYTNGVIRNGTQFQDIAMVTDFISDDDIKEEVRSILDHELTESVNRACSRLPNMNDNYVPW